MISADEIRRGVRTFATWQEIHAAPGPSRLEDIERRIAEFSCMGLLEMACRYNAIIQDHHYRATAHIGLFRALMSPELTVAFRQAIARGLTADGVLHRQQLLTFMKLALVRGRLEGGRLILADADDRDLGDLLLMINDDLIPPLDERGEDEERRQRVLAHMVLHNVLSHATHVINAIGRNARMLEVHEEFRVRGHREFFDLAAEFLRVTGVTIDTYLHHLFAILALADTGVPQLLAGNLRAIVIQPETALQGTAVEVDEFRATLRQLSLTPEQAHARLTDGRPFEPYFDFVLFQDYPLIEFPEGHFWPLDMGFILDKFAEGIFWLLHRPDPALDEASLTRRNRRFRQWWGRLFEEYAHRLMEFFFPPIGRYSRIPDDPGEAMTRCDAVLETRPELVLFEYKASYLRTDAKLSGSPGQLLEDVRRKVATAAGGGEGAKGIHQLAASCVRFHQTGEIPGLGAIGGIRRVYPVLVTLDAAFAANGMNRYLDELFKGAVGPLANPGVVAPLTVLTAEDLENVLPYTPERSFVDLLQTYHTEDPELLTSFRFVAQRRIRRERWPENGFTAPKALEWQQALIERYFPRRGDGAIT